MAVRTHPAGGMVGAALDWPVLEREGLSVRLGPALGAYVYWYEPALQARATVLGGLAVWTSHVGLEPGFYLPVEGGARRAALRPLVRERLELNLRSDRLWLYSRSTGLYRHHTFAEHDPYRDVDLDGTELFGEQSLAFLAAPYVQEDLRLWLYVEGTVEGIVGFGTSDLVARAGLLGEQVLPGLSFDLDLYWSFRESPVVGGAGALLVVWWNPRLGPREVAPP